MLTAEAGTSRIKVTQKTGPSSGRAAQGLAPVDPQWKPPACWYEPVSTPEQLKAGVDKLKQGGDLVRVTTSLSWGEELMVEHYEKGGQRSGGEDGSIGPQYAKGTSQTPPPPAALPTDGPRPVPRTP